MPAASPSPGQILALACVAGLLAACAVGIGPLEGPESLTVQGDAGSLHVVCDGEGVEGRPGVLLLHGAGSDAGAWSDVIMRVADETRVCAYDRPGHGDSDPLPGPRSPGDLLAEMTRVAREGGIEPPFVLGAHSLAGQYARLHALRRPDRVAALVLVDPTHEDAPDRLAGAIPEEARAEWIRERRRNADGVDETAIGEELRESSGLAVPVWVITAGLRRADDGYDPEEMTRVMRELHREILDDARGGHHVLAGTSGHDVPRQSPALVARTILDAVEVSALYR